MSMADSVRLLEQALRQESPADDAELAKAAAKKTYSTEYAIWRFLLSWKDGGQIGPDQAVLFRQILRWSGGLTLNSVPKALSKYFDRLKIKAKHGARLEAESFLPKWLSKDSIDKKEGIDAGPKERRINEEIYAEPYLKSLGHNTWKSRAQKEAAWKALSAPPGSTTLINLPTGAGKSLCFQMLPYFFREGLTLVIVPTIALAIDQYRSAKEMFVSASDINPMYFDSERADIVARAIKNRETKLVFASPETCVAGKLRFVIEESARSGILQNLVVDEAHIIYSWGAGFRVDFQLLSALHKKWKEATQNQLRTFLFSATITDECLSLLKKLFGQVGAWETFICQRLRPEISYYIAQFGSAELKQKALCESMWLMPRPCIFYTTKREDAKKLYGLFSENGFKRVECFHGDTPSKDRWEIIKKWRADKVDAVIATTAFGLGVDKPDVRAVVHACLPEDVNRYYQEVGRGGRDGASSVSLLMVGPKDFRDAASLTEKIMRTETIKERWEALYREGKSLSDWEWELPLNAQRMGLVGTTSGARNKGWNERLLLQLQRADMLEILDAKFISPDQSSSEDFQCQLVKVKIKFPAGTNVGAMIEKERREEVVKARKRLEDMKELLKLEKCISRYLKKLYGPSTQRVCGGCPVCRKNSMPAEDCRPLEFDCLPLELDVSENYSTKFGFVSRFPSPFTSNGLLEFRSIIVKLKMRHLLKAVRFICEEKYYLMLMNALEKCDLGSSQLYRFDYKSVESKICVSPEDRIVCLHFESLSDKLLQFSQGKEIIHCVTSDVKYMDRNGRYPKESQGARAYKDFDSLIREI